MRFGAYSTVLLATAANGLLLATLLVRPIGAHRGSRWLATLILTLVIRTAPYILGFAGAYDANPALTFAPFDLSLAWGPLFWCYVVTLSGGPAPRPLARHFLPVALQVAYQLACFALPLDAKWAWYTGTHLRVVEPLGAILVLISLGVYASAAWRTYGRWQQWLDQNVSNREESRLSWLRMMVLAMMGTAVLGTAVLGAHLLVGPLDYVARLPIVGVIGALTYLMGVLAFRFGRGAIAMTPHPAPPTEETLPSAAERGYAALAMAWRARIVTERWHHDAQLTLGTLASRLGTSPRTLSRVLNEGQGTSFNAFINALRVEDAIARLRQPGAPDVLRVAMDVGFASKASFNRAFRVHAGTTPTAIRDGEAPRGTDQLPPIAPLAPVESPESIAHGTSAIELDRLGSP